MSIIAAVYDPLGILSPIILEGRIILQNMCREKLSWDNEFGKDYQLKIKKWIEKLERVKNNMIPRCFKPIMHSDIISMEWHFFSDASQMGYGAVAYLRLIATDGSIFCNYIIGKTPVAPLKAVSLPRLELAAATLSVKLKGVLEKELDLEFNSVYFWTDSTTVLKYLHNRNLKFQTFVANRVVIIHDGSRGSKWRYIPSKLNPADDSTRAIQSERWCYGPEFLRQSKDL